MTTIENHVPTLENQNLKDMAQFVKNIQFPLNYDGSGLPAKITMGDGMSSLKSSEWQVWLLVSPLFILPYIGARKFNNWMKYVDICRILTCNGITDEDISNLGNLTKTFMQEFISIYKDARHMSCNFHMLLHIHEVCTRFGSGPSFWLYSFERRNKEVKSIKTNGKGNLEFTLLKKMVMKTHSNDYIDTLNCSAMLPASIDNAIRESYSLNQNGEAANGVIHPDLIDEFTFARRDFDLKEYLKSESESGFFGYEMLPAESIKSISLKALSEMDPGAHEDLVEYYNLSYGDLYPRVIPVSNKHRKFQKFNLFGSHYACNPSPGSYILATCRWSNDEADGDSCLRPAQVFSFFQHYQEMEGEDQPFMHLFAKVRWFKKPHHVISPFNTIGYMGMCSNEFEDSEAIVTIIPVHSIYCPLAIVLNQIDNLHGYIQMPRHLFT